MESTSVHRLTRALKRRYETLDTRYDMRYDIPLSPVGSHRPKEHKLSNPKSHVGYKILSEPPNRPENQTQQLRKGTCPFCGKKFLMEVKGRKRIWCSNACKSAAYRYRYSSQGYPQKFRNRKEKNKDTQP